MAISTDLNPDFLSLDEKERYKKHLTLKEIGFKGQLKLKNSSVICIGACHLYTSPSPRDLDLSRMPSSA